jgi:hypothetical protein
MTKRLLIIGLVVAAAVVASLGAAGAQAHRSASGFSATVDNQWFPLIPGTRYAYQGVKDGKPSRDVMLVTHRTRTIQGAPCVVVKDRLYLRGHLAEKTTDWYSQDAKGNVWYFGEATEELDANGHVTSRAGTWTAGKKGAKPGIYMPAHPHLYQSGRQEYRAGQAEDHYKVVGLFHTVSPSGPHEVLLTQEWSPLEPGVLDHKMYAKGIGVVLEQTERGPQERNELVGVRHVK